MGRGIHSEPWWLFPIGRLDLHDTLMVTIAGKLLAALVLAKAEMNAVPKLVVSETGREETHIMLVVYESSEAIKWTPKGFIQGKIAPERLDGLVRKWSKVIGIALPASRLLEAPSPVTRRYDIALQQVPQGAAVVTRLYGTPPGNLSPSRNVVAETVNEMLQLPLQGETPWRSPGLAVSLVPDALGITECGETPEPLRVLNESPLQMLFPLRSHYPDGASLRTCGLRIRGRLWLPLAAHEYVPGEELLRSR